MLERKDGDKELSGGGFSEQAFKSQQDKAKTVMDSRCFLRGPH